MDNQREMFEDWFDTTFAGVPMAYTEETVAWQAWQAAQKAQWQPIETAPKDGVVFFAQRKYTPFPVLVCYNKNYDWFESYPMGEHLYDLTHWQHCPEEPTE